MTVIGDRSAARPGSALRMNDVEQIAERASRTVVLTGSGHANADNLVKASSVREPNLSELGTLFRLPAMPQTQSHSDQLESTRQQ